MYCTAMDVRRRLPEVTAEIVRDSTIEYFIDESDSYIDGYLREIYSVPFTTAPTLIAKLSAMYSAYLTLTDFPDSSVSEDLDRLKADIDAIIGDLVLGKLTLASSYKLGNPSNEPYFVTTRSGDYDSTYTAPTDRNWYRYYGVDQ